MSNVVAGGLPEKSSHLLGRLPAQLAASHKTECRDAQPLFSGREAIQVDSRDVALELGRVEVEGVAIDVFTASGQHGTGQYDEHDCAQHPSHATRV